MESLLLGAVAVILTLVAWKYVSKSAIGVEVDNTMNKTGQLLRIKLDSAIDSEKMSVVDEHSEYSKRIAEQGGTEKVTSDIKANKALFDLI